MDGLTEPHDGNADDSDSFNKRGNGICDGGGGRKDDECDDVLRKMNGPIHEKVIRHRMGCGSSFCRSGCCSGQQDRKIVINPDGHHQQKCHS